MYNRGNLIVCKAIYFVKLQMTKSREMKLKEKQKEID